MNRPIRVLSPRLLVGALVLFAAGSLSASPLCTSVGATLDQFIGTSCSVGNYLFTFPSGGSSYTSPVPASDVTVTIVGNGLSPSSPTGFLFTSSWVADPANGGYSDLNISFDVSIAGLNYINSGTLAMGVNHSQPDGLGDFVIADETLGGSGGGEINLTIYGNNDAQSESYASGTALNGTASVYGQSFTLSKDIFLGALDGSSTTTVNSLEETFTFTAVPEPGPFVLTGGALGLLFLARRSRKLLQLFGLAVIFLVGSAGSAHASQLCTNVGTNLGQLISAGSCSIGDVLFTFTGASYQTSGNAQLVDNASQVTVGEDNTNGLIGFYMVPVVTGIYTGTPINETVTISFIAQSALQPILGAYGSYTGQNLSEAQLEVLNGGSDISTIPPGNDPLNLLTIGSASATFTSAIAAGTPLTLTDTLNLSMNSPGVTHVSAAEMDVAEPASSVPEPVTMVLTGSSLLGLAFYLRRKGFRA